MGRVDELDDLVPGHNHMADHPTPISATTEIPPDVEEESLDVPVVEAQDYQRSKAPEPETPRIEEAKELGRIPIEEDAEVEDMVLDEPVPSKAGGGGSKDSA